MSLEQARRLMALKEQNNTDRLEAYGRAEALLRVQKSFQIVPALLQVGMFRVKKLKNKRVVYSRGDHGIFRTGDPVRIDRGGVLTETSVLEAYDYDPDVPENDFDLNLRASGGKQRLTEGQLGWLTLDYERAVFPGDRIVG